MSGEKNMLMGQKIVVKNRVKSVVLFNISCIV